MDCRGLYTPEQRPLNSRKRFASGNQLVDEFLAADLYVIGIPILSAFPAFKEAYIDQIVRVGRTFAFEPENSASLQTPCTVGKCLSLHEVILALNLVSASEKLNYQDPYLRTLFDSLASPTSPLFMLRMTSLVASLAQSIAAARTQVAQLVRGGDAAISDNSTTLLGGNPQEAFMTTVAHLL